MHRSGSQIIRRALIVDGLFCVGVGALLAIAAGWLAGELPVSDDWLIVAAGVVTALWGALLVVASRSFPARALLMLVAAVNVATVVAVLAWLAIDGEAMSGIGIAVVGILGVSVLRFAIYQVMLLRQ
jgi:hypothetical protein